MAIPHDRIRARLDRSWTPALVARLRGADAIERLEVARTLSELADPGAVAPLTALLTDPGAPSGAREDASELLRDALVDSPTDATLRAWWRSGDGIVRAHALRTMDVAQADLVRAVADQPDHPLHAQALETLGWDFETPADQRRKIAGLAHPDPAVRLTAARALVWHQPCAAQGPLIASLADPVPEVGAAAAATLSWYRSRRALAALAGRASLDDEERADVETVALSFVEAVRGLPAAARPALVRWLAPVADILAELGALADEDDDEPAPVDPEPRRAPLGEVVDADRLLAALAVVDGPWAPTRIQLAALEPSRVDPTDRARLARAAVAHRDPEVRARAAGWCATWRDGRSLDALCEDPSFLVRKHAWWALAALPCEPERAARLRAHLVDPTTAGAHACETLRSYLAHADPDEATETLAGLVRDDVRQSVREEAVRALTALGARGAMASLLPLIAASPQVTWSVHVALLAGARALDLDLDGGAALAEVDDLDLQLELSQRDA